MTDKYSSLSFRLFPRPSFWEGMGRVLDIGGGISIYNTSSSPTRADYLALASDWSVVGGDMCKAMENYERERGKTGR